MTEEKIVIHCVFSQEGPTIQEILDETFQEYMKRAIEKPSGNVVSYKG